MALTRPVYIVAAKRTAFGAFGGKLKGLTATVLGEKASIAALESGKVDPAIVDHVIFGNVIQVRLQSRFITMVNGYGGLNQLIIKYKF